ncbi:MAG: LysE family transporter [Bacillota bacterium]|nr:LysE family transporter [Bacillota bacterium]
MFGSLVLLMFRMKMIFNSIYLSNEIMINPNSLNYFKTFITVIVLTGSNPLTIIFWSSVFSTKIIEENYDTKDLILFAVGALTSTFVFLSFIIILGQFTRNFLSKEIISILNIIIGFVLICFAIKLFFHKEENKSNYNKN